MVGVVVGALHVPGPARARAGGAAQLGIELILAIDEEAALAVDVGVETLLFRLLEAVALLLAERLAVGELQHVGLAGGLAVVAAVEVVGIVDDIADVDGAGGRAAPVDEVGVIGILGVGLSGVGVVFVLRHGRAAPLGAQRVATAGGDLAGSDAFFMQYIARLVDQFQRVRTAGDGGEGDGDGNVVGVAGQLFVVVGDGLGAEVVDAGGGGAETVANGACFGRFLVCPCAVSVSLLDGDATDVRAFVHGGIGRQRDGCARRGGIRRCGERHVRRLFVETEALVPRLGFGERRSPDFQIVFLVVEIGTYGAAVSGLLIETKCVIVRALSFQYNESVVCIGV